MAKVPTAPMDVHTAYAVPIGMPFNEYQSKSPLSAMLVPAKAMPQIFMAGLLDSFNPSGQPISKNPANKRDSQYILGLELIEKSLYQSFSHLKAGLGVFAPRRFRPEPPFSCRLSATRFLSDTRSRVRGPDFFDLVQFPTEAPFLPVTLPHTQLLRCAKYSPRLTCS